jgi:hypothetical protein
VVGAPDEIAPAIADTRRFEKDGRAAIREILERRHISYVLGCGMARDAQAFGRPVPFAVPGFYLFRVG